jgi:general secretion pathway protein I
MPLEMSMLPVKPVAYQTGFTLMEMLVALAVFSLAALAMVNLQGYSVKTVATLSDSALAWQVAQNLAVERLSAPSAPAIGTEEGEVENGGRNWRWKVLTAKTEDTRLVTMEISVAGVRDSAKRNATLSVARLVER